jgi:peptidoglycan hydrolase-like protein with peptidoglycan-binding domain
VAKEGGIFGDLFGKKDDKKPEAKKPDAVAAAKAKQKAQADERAKEAHKALNKKQMDAKFVSPNLPVDGQWGAATTKAVQTALGQPLTGEAWINNSDATVLQQKLGVTADGLFGKGSNTALQSYLGVTADGVFGPISVKALQTRLNAGTFFGVPAKVVRTDASKTDFGV